MAMHNQSGLSARDERPVNARRAVLSLLALGLQLTMLRAEAYWELVPQVNSGISFEDNPRYVADGAPDSARQGSASGTFIDIGLDATLATPDDSVVLSPRLHKTSYLLPDHDLNDDARSLALSASHRAGRGEVGAIGGYSEVGVRSAAFESATPQNPDGTPRPDEGSGRYINIGQTQNNLYIAPYISYNFSQRNSFQVGGDTSKTTYDQSFELGNIDYKATSISATLTHSLNPKNAFVVTVNSSTFKADDPGTVFRNNTDSHGLTVGYQRAVTPTLSGSLMLGTSRSSQSLTFAPDFRFPNPCGNNFFTNPCRASSDSQNFVGDLSIRKRSELTTLNFDLSRYEAPQSDGRKIIVDSARFYVSRPLTASLAGGFGTVLRRESGLAGSSGKTNDFLSADTSIRWQIARGWSCSGRYSFVLNKDNNFNLLTGQFDRATQKNNVLTFGVEYRGVGIRR